MNREKALRLVENQKFLKTVLDFNIPKHDLNHVARNVPSEISYLIASGFITTPYLLRTFDLSSSDINNKKSDFLYFDTDADRLVMLTDLSLKKLVCYLGVALVGRSVVKNANYDIFSGLLSKLGIELYEYLMSYARYCSYGDAFEIASEQLSLTTNKISQTVVTYGILCLMNFSKFSSKKIKKSLFSRLITLFPILEKQNSEIFSNDYLCSDPKKIAKLIEQILIQECNEKWITCLA